MIDEDLRQTNVVIRQIVRKAFRPVPRTIRELDAAISNAADSASRDPTECPEDKSLRQVVGHILSLTLIPVVIHEIPRVRPIRRSWPCPVADEF
jgi:hypothetical protein